MPRALVGVHAPVGGDLADRVERASEAVRGVLLSTEHGVLVGEMCHAGGAHTGVRAYGLAFEARYQIADRVAERARRDGRVCVGSIAVKARGDLAEIERA